MATWLQMRDKAFRLDYDSCSYAITWGPYRERQHETFERVGSCVDRMSALAAMREPFQVIETLDGEPQEIGKASMEGDDYVGEVNIWKHELIWKCYVECVDKLEVKGTLGKPD